MLFLPSDNIFKFSEIIDAYLLFKKKGLFTELKIIEWGEQVSKAFITIYGYKLLELNKTMKFKKLFKFLKLKYFTSRSKNLYQLSHWKIH